MKESISKILRNWGKVFLITLLIVLFVRSFLIESYSVSSVQMETALLKGDRVLVDKTAYGIRMPITLLSIPFTYDTFLGFKSYSELIQLNYKRLFTSEINRNDVVVFNNSSETDKPIDKRSICISRCVAKPGDTVVVDGYNYLINGKEYVTSPDFLLRFKFKQNYIDSLKSVIAVLSIPLRNYKVSGDSAYASFNRYEEFLINQNLTDSLKITLAEREVSSYKIVVPKAGMKMPLNMETLSLYGKSILDEKGSEATITNGSLFVAGKKVDSYTFQFNYYWFLSDNVNESVDSRYIGFISEKDIIGRAFTIWYSSDKGKIRWNRIFSGVK
jgi:signal peptidase I